MSTSQTNNIGQVAMEFLLMTGFSIIMIIILLIVVLNISQSNAESRTYDDIRDFGQALQQELLLASELEDGYIRELDIPLTINSQQYNITIYNSTKYTYMIITYMLQEIYYAVPPIEGEFKKGKTYLHKNDTLYLT